MNSSKRNESILAIILTMTSGCADAISFLTLGAVLTAAMTGNTVFLGLSFVKAGGLEPAGFVTALSGFMLGVAAGAVILWKRRNETGLNRTVTLTICVELLAFVLFGILVSTVNSPNRFLLIIILSFAMGVQGIAARRIGVNGVPTTVITSTTTGLIESLVWNAFTRRNSKNANIVFKTAAIPQSSLWIWLIDIFIYGIGAAICGAAVLKWHLQAIWLPAAVVFFVVLLAIFFQSRPRER